MAGLTHLLCVELIFFIFISHSTKVDSLVRSDCPVGCKCEAEMKKVECAQWSRDDIPPLPNGTKQLHINGGIFILKKTDCQNYREVVELKLNVYHTVITSLKCVPKLQFLIIESNDCIGVFVNVSLKNLPSLRTISMDMTHHKPWCTSNNLKTFVSNLCFTPQLEKVVWRHQSSSITFEGLDCLANLRNLTYVDLSFNSVFGPITNQTLEPLEHVTNYVSLKGCNISELGNYIFAGFKMKVLDLSHNEISYIPRYTFSDMSDLKILDLSSNFINETKEWFGELSVEVIHLRENRLTKVPSITRNMQEVYFGGNKFYILTSRSFSHLDKLLKLDLSSCDVTRIERNAFYNLTKLEVLDISSNSISGPSLHGLLTDLVHCPLRVLNVSANPLHILNKTFETFQPNQLKMLYLRSCRIYSILPGTFRNFNELCTLDLSNNRLNGLGPDIFKGLKKLTHLHLTNNHLTGEASNIFKGLTKLTHLYLEHNYLQGLHVRLTELGNSSLIELHAKSNHIKDVTVKSISTLMMLDLSHNNIVKFKIQSLDYLKKLDLSRNTINVRLAYLSMRTCPNLSYLDLSDNHVYISLDSHGPMDKLYFLDLSQIKLTLPPSFIAHCWQKLYQLRKLRISDCQIKLLFPGKFSTLNHLYELDASSNEIPFVEPTAFLNATSLRRLNLENNRITYVNWDSFVHVPHLRVLSLAGNPILCTCQALWIMQAITTNRLVFIQDDFKLHCQGPPSVQSYFVMDSMLTISGCEDNWLVTYLKPLGIALVSVLSISLLYITWRYRWHVRYALFLAKAGQGRYEEFCDDSEYIYDAFVAYSSEDLPWVKNQLLPNIDVNYIGHTGFKLCLHHRDWLAGVDIVENIVKSLAESRRTILVLSKDFALSHWCQFELAMAQMKLDAHGRKRDRLVVILLNDIPAELLTPRLIYILTTKTYLPWSRDPNEHGLFWKTLRKSLWKELLYGRHGKKDIQLERQ